MLRALPLIVVAGYHFTKPPTCSSPKISMSDASDARVDVAKVATAPELSGRGATADPIGWTHTGHTVPRHSGPSEYELNRGRVVDTLRRDYPKLFKEEPDLSIFTEGIELHDPTGVRLRGIKNYKRMFDTLRFLRRTAMQDAEVTYRLVATDGSVRAPPPSSPPRAPPHPRSLRPIRPPPPRPRLTSPSPSAPSRCASAGRPRSGRATPRSASTRSGASPRSSTSTASRRTTWTPRGW